MTYDIIDAATSQSIGSLQVDPYQFSVEQGAPEAVVRLLENARDMKEMNRTTFDGDHPAAEPDGSNPPTSLEKLQKPSPEYRLRQVNRLLGDNYLLQQRGPEATAAREYQEGDKVTVDGAEAVVVEVRTSDFEGPDGSDVAASDDSPAYIVATQDGAEAVSAADIDAADWTTDVSDPDEKLAQDRAEGADADSLEAGPTDFDYPDSWEESETPNRLILLDAWSSMGGQFDCGGSCCKGTMMSGGMSEGAANRFCASMKDRVLLWEGWRQGGD